MLNFIKQIRDIITYFPDLWANVDQLANTAKNIELELSEIVDVLNKINANKKKEN